VVQSQAPVAGRPRQAGECVGRWGGSTHAVSRTRIQKQNRVRHSGAGTQNPEVVAQQAGGDPGSAGRQDPAGRNAGPRWW